MITTPATSRTTAELLSDIDRAVETLAAAAKAATALARSIASTAGVAAADDDRWLRMPAAPRRCPVSGWSRRTIENHAKAGSIRTKLVKGGRFYAGADVARLIKSA